jgi:hypothetical protein
VLFTDLDPVTLLAGQITGLPTAITYTSVVERGYGSLPWRAIRRAANSVLHEHVQAPGDPHRLYFGPRVAKIIPSVPSWTTPTRLAPVRPVSPTPGP